MKLLKKIFLLFIIATLIFTLSSCGSKKNEEDNKKNEDNKKQAEMEVKNEVSEWETTQIITYNNSPYTKRDETGKIIGYTTEKIRGAMKKIPIDIPIDMMTWDAGYSLVQTKAKLFIYSIVRNDENENLFKWVSHLKTSNVVLYSLVSKKDIKIKNNSDMSKYKISGVKNDSTLEGLKKISSKNSLDLKLYIKKTNSDALSDVFSGKSELFISLDGKEEIANVCREIGKDPNELKEVYTITDLKSELYLAASIGTPDKLVDEFRKALETTYN